MPRDRLAARGDQDLQRGLADAVDRVGAHLDPAVEVRGEHEPDAQILRGDGAAMRGQMASSDNRFINAVSWLSRSRKSAIVPPRADVSDDSGPSAAFQRRSDSSACAAP